MEIALLILLGYVLGSISFSTLVARKVAGIDIRKHGSQNAGATNTLRVLGVGPAVLVLILDVVKGIVPVWIALNVTSVPVWVVGTGLAAIIGHNWPLFFAFKGGKGVATTIGVVATLAFWPALVAGVIAILMVVLFRYVSLGSLVFVTLLPLTMFFFQYSGGYIAGALAIMFLSYFRHRTNIVRLVKGQENKLGGTS